MVEIGQQVLMLSHKYKKKQYKNVCFNAEKTSDAGYDNKQMLNKKERPLIDEMVENYI
jgi:hypothetical protein